MFRHALVYFLLAILFLNYAEIMVNTNTLLNESKESELGKYPSLSDNLKGSTQENKSMKISDITQKTPTIDLPKAEGRSITSHTPPSTPPTGYIEKYVDTLTDYHIPSDIGVIYDWTKMQSYDFTYSQLSEGMRLVDNETYWYSPNSYENLGGALSNPEKLYASDNEYAQANQAGYVTVYNFNLPDFTEATMIKGIEVTVEAKKGDSGNPTDVSVNLLWNSRSFMTNAKTNTFGENEEIKVYGGASDTWDRSWIGTDFTNNNFGVELTNEGKIRMDHVQVKIYYTIEFFEFDREFSFELPPLYDEEQELCIRTGTLANEDLNVDLWNSSASTWISILNLQNSDSDTWKNVSLTSYLPNSNFHFRFIGGTTIVDATNDTWQIDAVLIKYKLIAPNFLYRRNITLDHTQVAAPLTNFPVLIDLYDRELHDHAQVNGTDILFTHSSGIKLAHEIEYFNQTGNGTHAHLIAWVKVPALSDTSDIRISLYYGNATIGNQENAVAVWDDFLTVHHMEEDPIAPISDSTMNHQNMTSAGAMTPSDLVDSQIGKGIDFDGTDDTFISINPLTINNDFTLSLWVQFNVYQTQGLIGINTTTAGSGTDNFRYVYMDSNNRFAFSTASSNFNFGTFNTGSWIQVFLIYNASTSDLRAYLNGTQSGSNQTVTLPAITELFQFASFRGADFLDGRLDEVRICKVARSADWIITEYNNQRAPTNFYSLDLEEHMEDLDPPEIVAFGVTDPGNGHPEFWANLTDDFSGVFNVTLSLNGTEQVMTLNATGYWVFHPLSVNFRDYFTYQIVNASDNQGRFLATSSEVKNITFDYDNLAPAVDDWEYYPDIHPPEGTFNANVSDPWGEGIGTVIVNVTDVNGLPAADWAYMRNTSSGYINDTLSFPRASVIEFVIFVNDTAGNTNTSTPHIGYVGANNPPIAENLTLIPDPVQSNETLRLRYDYYDDQNDPQAGTIIRWYKNGDLNFTEPIYGVPGTTYSSELPASYLIAGDQWYATVTPKDWKDYGPVNTSATITIQNSAPTLASYFITPSQAYTTSILNCVYAYFDNDNDPENVTSREVRWYMDTTLQPALNNLLTVDAAFTKKGETWYFRLRVHDGDEYSTWYQSAPQLIANSPPTAAGLNIVNAVNLYTDDDLVANWTFNDDDINDTQASYLIRWYRNGIYQPGLDDLMTVDASFTARGESWYFTLQVSDGTDPSAVYTLASSVVILNTIPVAGNLTVTPNPTSVEDLAAEWDYFDLDGDPQSTLWLIQWFKDGAHQAALDNQQTIDAAYTSKGEVWYYELHVHDGVDYSLLYISPSTVIQNTPPSIANLRFGGPTPDFVVEDEALTVNYTFVDPDLDPDQSIIYWYRDGVRQDQYTNWTSLPASALSPGEVWRVEVIAADGEVIGPTVSVTIPVESR
ncbi:MAG: DUF2341 domain-containing protein, partial [Candidatus Hermodarchaeota archaeon]